MFRKHHLENMADSALDFVFVMWKPLLGLLLIALLALLGWNFFNSYEAGKKGYLRLAVVFPKSLTNTEDNLFLQGLDYRVASRVFNLRFDDKLYGPTHYGWSLTLEPNQ